MTINSNDSRVSAIRYGNIVYLSLSSGSQIGYSAPGMSCSLTEGTYSQCSLSLFLIVSFSSLPVVAAAIEITFLFLYFDLSSSCTRILPMLALSWSAVVRPGLVRWERRSDRVPQVRRFARNACHRVVRMAMGSVRRSLSSLINVVSLLIYRRVAAQPTDDTTLLGTTLGIPISGLWARFINYDHGRSINLPKLDTLSSNTL